MKGLSVVLLLLLAAGSGAQNRTSHASAPLAESNHVEALGFSGARLDRVDLWLQGLVKRGELPGAVWLVARRGEVARLRAVGYADLEMRRPMRPDAIFRLASATKIVTAVALLTLYEEGRFRLNDPVSKYLPEFRDLRVFRPDGTTTPATAPITIRDLLRHTSGYGYGYRDPQETAYRQAGLLGPGPDLDLRHDLTLEVWAARLAGVPLADEPGTRFDYGFSSDIAGLLIERLTGRRLDAALEERVLLPLGMSDTGFAVPKDRLDRLTSIYQMQDGRWEALDRPASTPFRRVPKALSGGGGWDNEGGGGLVSTAPDLFRFLQMLLNGGELDGTRVLGSKTVELMFKNHLADLATPYRTPGVGFGFGYAVVDDDVKRGEVGSTGSFWWAGSTNVHYWADPREGLIGLFLSQVRPFPYRDLMETPRHLTWIAITGPPAPRDPRGAAPRAPGTDDQPGTKTYPLDSLAGLRPHNVSATAVLHSGRRAIRVTGQDGESPREEGGLIILEGTDFRDGIIEVELAGRPRQGAGAGARGFVGVAFRVAPDISRFECIYLRPTNGRADDQVRRNHSVQYVSVPDFPWQRLRSESPGKYESYVDLVPGEWTKVRIEVRGATAKLNVHGADQPSLVINDLKLGETRGAIALWIGTGTEAHFTDLRVSGGKDPGFPGGGGVSVRRGLVREVGPGGP